MERLFGLSRVFLLYHLLVILLMLLIILFQLAAKIKCVY
uniref:Uncharacterized protein n=1 Tax=Siphoviridae sp. ctxMM9 TaxID=2827973 RepID=A0A8S5T7M0_9CAUD|nr:MAG TPA: hypothetical protein [Siphoviridae sp. ctxMM9]